MYPAFVAAAFFVAVVINDLIQQNPPMDLAKHAFFGFIVVLGLWALAKSGRIAIAWGLFIVPLFVFIGSFLYVIITGTGEKHKFVPAAPAPAPSAVSEPAPVLNLPDESTVCVEMTFDPNAPKPEPTPTCEVSDTTGEVGMPGTLPKPQSKPSQDQGQGNAQKQASASTEDVLGELNRRLTPYTVCDSA
jgi:hypothetical protein